MCILFLYFLLTQMADRSQTSTGLSDYVYGGLHKVLTLPAKKTSVIYFKRANNI